MSLIRSRPNYRGCGISARVTPVVVINIPFGRDNHQDATLEQERDQTISGVSNYFLWAVV